MLYLLFAVGVALFGLGSWAFIYARDHAPTPGADPMAGQVLSHAAYGRLHYGGIGLLVLALLLIAAALVGGVRRVS